MKKVHFICIGNTCRSQMAKGFFNILNLSKSADNAGIKLETHVASFAIKVINEVGIDINPYKPKKLKLEIQHILLHLI
jgi:arsenate reductase (thioredoxin)